MAHKDKTSFKKLTNHERYNLARENLIGKPHVIAHIVTYPTSALPKYEHLADRITELQNSFPKLFARVEGALTTNPGFIPGHAPWRTEDIVVEGLYTPQRNAMSEAADAMKSEMDRFEKYHFSQGDPLWTVALLRGPPDSERAYLVFQVNHLLSDGRGSLAILHALLAPSIGYLTPESPMGPARWDDTHPIKPTARYLLPVVFRELILPKLPKAIQTKLIREDPWPGPNVARSPLVCGTGMSHCSIPAGTVEQLKIIARENGIRTLHPLLKTAYLAAMWRVCGEGNSVPPVHFVAMTAKDERDKPRYGHSALTGSYMGSMRYRVNMSGTERYWNAARSTQSWVASPRHVAEGRYVLGALSHIPEKEQHLPPDSAEFDVHTPTGWEKYFFDRATGPTPFRDTFMFANIGKTTLPPAAEDYMWAQTANPVGTVYLVNIVGHEAGIRLTAVFVEGAAVTKLKTDALLNVWLRVLDRIVLGEGGRTIAELTE